MKFTIRIWIALIFLVLALISIFVSQGPAIMFLEKGVIVKSIDSNSSLFEQGISPGSIIKGLNGNAIESLEDYQKIASELIRENPGEKQKLEIQTNDAEVVGLFHPTILNDLVVDKIPKTRIQTGLDIRGGARAFIAAKDAKITEEQLDDLISISQERLNVYGISDVNLRKASDLSGNRFMIVEIAGSSPSELKELISNQGKFEAKIAEEVVFTGGKEDITYVGRTGQDAGIYECFPVEGGEVCNFRFVIYLSEAAAQRHADLTGKLGLNSSSGGQYLEKPIDFYLDGELTTSLNIGADLKGRATTSIQISGSETGLDREQAIENTGAEMKKLQTLLITGSLPFELEVVKTDTISPILGDEFSKVLFYATLLAAIGVFVLIFVRYRKIIISTTVMLTLFSEVAIVLGIASLIKWNIDLAGIAGIIAAIGTGVDDQIVIIDESKSKNESSIKKRIKNALFIILTAYATAVVSLLPLFWAGAGLLKGFAFTTLIGITAGVFITRPAFADIIKNLEEKKENGLH
jgi:preprotein translocase subunit SecD